MTSFRQKLARARPSADEAERLLRLARPHTGRLSLGVLLLAGSAVAGLGVPLVLARLVDQVLGPGGSISELNAFVAALGALFVARAVLSVGHTYLLASTGESIVLGLRETLYAQLTALGPPFHDRRRVGELVSRLMTDVVHVQGVLTSGVAELLTHLVTLAGAIAVMLLTSWQLALSILVVVPPVVLLARTFAREMRRRSLEVQDRMADAAAVAEESLGSIRLVQLFGREPYERQRFGSAVKGVFGAAIQRVRVQAVFGPAVSLLAFGAMAIVLWFGGRLVIAGEIGLGSLVAFLAYAGMSAGAASGLVNVYGRWAGALGASRRVFELIDTQPVIVDRPDATVLEGVRGSIDFDNVSFSYGRGDGVLREVSFSVEDGQTLALVGPTGAGKSTVMHLIARFYDPTRGVVRIDDADISGVTLASLRRWIAVVPQEVVLFNATIAENLRYGNLSATTADLEAATDAANILDFVRSLPERFETVVGEKGIKLSAGQRQRLAIARAMLKNPRILLLDEATSSLDSESERAVQGALERLFEGRTTVVVAHRLSTVFRADQIIVLDQGQVVERGRHADLLKRGGLYARFCKLQFGALQTSDRFDKEVVGADGGDRAADDLGNARDGGQGD